MKILEYELLGLYFSQRNEKYFVERLNELCFLLTGKELSSVRKEQLESFHKRNLLYQTKPESTYNLAEGLILYAHVRANKRKTRIVLYFTVNDKYRSKYLQLGLTEKVVNPERFIKMQRPVDTKVVRSQMLEDIKIPWILPTHRLLPAEKRLILLHAAGVAIISMLFQVAAFLVLSGLLLRFCIQTRKRSLLFMGVLSIAAFMIGGWTLSLIVIITEVCIRNFIK